MGSLKVNDTFASYQELREAVNRYEVENRVQFWKRDVKTIKTAEYRAPQVYQMVRNYPELEYYYIKFACIHGGQAFRAKLRHGLRTSRGTWKQNCKAEISVGLNKDRNRLIINNIISEHNHEIPSREVYRQFRKQRKISEQYRNAKKEMLRKRKLDRSLLQKTAANVLMENGRVLLDNVVNINSTSRSNNLKRIANILSDKYSCCVDLQSDKDGKVHGFFFQDPQMKKFFKLFPEILLMDGTYKLLNINCCIYVLSVEHSFGSTDVVGVAVLTVEDTPSVEWMINTFKNRNPNWENTDFTVVDKKTSDRKIVAKQFPKAKNLICPTNALHVFKKEIAPPRLSYALTPEEFGESLHFFKCLSEAATEEQYASVVETMTDELPYPVVNYFEKNWHECRNEWVRAFGGNFKHLIDSKLDISHSRLKSTVSVCKSFMSFVEKLFLVLYVRRAELQNEYTKTVLKIPNPGDETPAEQSYKRHLTPYAFSRIELLHDCRFRKENDDVICEQDNDTFIVSETSCNCDLFSILKLPCHYVILYRKSLGLNLFHDSLFAPRWTKKYMKLVFDDMKEDVQRQEEVPEKSVEEKFAEAQTVCSTLAALCSDSADFDQRLELLTELQQHWENGSLVKIEPSSPSRCENIQNDHDYVEDETDCGCATDDHADTLTINIVP